MFHALVVDNNITRANLTARALKSLNFGARLNYALSAAQALYYLAALRDDPKRILPDMVVLSADLPDAEAGALLPALLRTIRDHPIAVVVICEASAVVMAPDYYHKGAEAVVPRSSDPELYTQELGDTVCFIAMMHGLIPRQPRFLPQKQHNPLTFSEILQVHL